MVASAGAEAGRRLSATGWWLIQSTVLIFVRSVRFLSATKLGGFLAGLVLVLVFLALDETPAIDQQSLAAIIATITFELFVIAVFMRIALGFGNPARRAGWIRFLASWGAGWLALVVVASMVLILGSRARFGAAAPQLSVIAGVAAAVIVAGAVSNVAGLRRALTAERSSSAERLTERRIMKAIASRPLPTPEAPVYSSWYAWAACALSASPAVAHRAAVVAVSSLLSGADAGRAADAARRSRWTPAGLLDRVKRRA